MLKYIVTGCPRSGTCYMAHILTELGIPTGHEAYFDHRGIEGYKLKLIGKIFIQNSPISLKQGKWVDIKNLQADSSYAAAPFLNDDLIKHIPIIHIIRNPLNVIKSLVKDFNYFKKSIPNDKWEKFIYYHLPELADIETPIERACYFWIKWNTMVFDACKDKKHYVHHIEKGITPKLLSFFDYSGVVPTLPDNINTKRKNNFIWTKDNIPNGIIKNNFIEFANKVGYIV